jgi:hypothetical protein
MTTKNKLSQIKDKRKLKGNLKRIEKDHDKSRLNVVKYYIMQQLEILCPFYVYFILLN